MGASDRTLGWRSRSKHMDLSIIIVAFRNQEKLRITLEAVFKSVTNFKYEVIVVDNDSKDGTAEMVEREFPQTKLLRNENNGFSKGNNFGIKRADQNSRYILLLNPDTRVEPNVLEECIKKMDSDTSIGILGCKLLRENGELDWACRRNIPNPWNSFTRLFGLQKLFPKSKVFASYNLMHVPIGQETEVGAVTGAFLMIRRSVMEKIGLLDEDFFMYGEDLDWCCRCTLACYKVWYFPKVTTIHYKGQSSKKAPYRSLHAFYSAMWIFYKKHYLKKYPFILNWLVYLGIWTKFTAVITINFFKKNKVVSK